MSFFKNKKILVTGGTGLIGIPLTKFLIEEKADVTIVSLDDKSRCHKGARFIYGDLRNFDTCLKICKKKEIVFHLAGIKGSPAVTLIKPASFFYPTISFNTNMMEAARRCDVERYLYTSSIGVYHPRSILSEDDVWNSYPSDNDKFAGWAKRMGELQAQAYSIEYGWKKISIVRPANVYGPYDNFDINNAMVIPSIINKVFKAKKRLDLWGDGTPIRDFIFSEDVAKNMMQCIKKGVYEPINLGSGKGTSIKKLLKIILKNFPEKKLDVKWDTTKPSGDKKRIMSTKKALSYKIKAETDLSIGIKKTVEWFRRNQNLIYGRFNSFTEKR